MKEDMKKRYIAPDIVSVSFKTERGYAASVQVQDLTNEINLFLENQAGQAGQDQNQGLEAFEVANDWGGYNQDNGNWVSGDNHFWD